MQRIRIIEEQLQFDDTQALLNGIPFSGDAFLVYPNGRLKREVAYKDGFEEGLCREWHANGQLKRQWNAIHGRAEGRTIEWHENGTVKSVIEAELGVVLSHCEWKEDGQPLSEWRIDASSAQYRVLQQMKKAGSSQ